MVPHYMTGEDLFDDCVLCTIQARHFFSGVDLYSLML